MKPAPAAAGDPIDPGQGQGQRLGFRHCDPRFGFLWSTAAQPPARWHGPGEGPANCFADTPDGAWAEFLRHEGITDAADLAGVRRSLWTVQLPEAGWVRPELAEAQTLGGLSSYAECQAEARRLRAAGHQRLQAPSAALQAGGARGWVSTAAGVQPSAQARDGQVWVCFGTLHAVGWLSAEAGAPPESVLPKVRPLTP